MDNKNNILNNALELFSRKGYDGTGVQEICLMSEITKPTLYHYFGSKKGLLNELLGYYFTILDTELREAASYSGDLVFTLEKIVSCYFSFAGRFNLFYRTHLAFAFGPPESDATIAVAERLAPHYQLIEKMFLSAVVQHGNMRGREKVYAATFLGVINTYISLNFYGNFKLDDQDVYRLVHQFMHGILS